MMLYRYLLYLSWTPYYAYACIPWIFRKVKYHFHEKKCLNKFRTISDVNKNQPLPRLVWYIYNVIILLYSLKKLGFNLNKFSLISARPFKMECFIDSFVKKSIPFLVVFMERFRNLLTIYHFFFQIWEKSPPKYYKYTMHNNKLYLHCRMSLCQKLSKFWLLFFINIYIYIYIMYMHIYIYIYTITLELYILTTFLKEILHFPFFMVPPWLQGESSCTSNYSFYEVLRE